MMRVLSGYSDRICEFEPDAKMPLSEAYPFGWLIRILATAEYQIHAIQESNNGFIVRAGDRTTPILPPDTMVYVKFDTLEHERNQLNEHEKTIQTLKDKYGVTE